MNLIWFMYFRWT